MSTTAGVRWGRTARPATREEPVMGLINPETGSEIEVEADGDFTVTFSMTLPQPAADTNED